MPSASCAPFPFDHQDAGLAARMGDMLAAGLGEKDVARTQRHDFFRAAFAVVHVDGAVEHREDLFAVVDVPPVGLIGPVKAPGRAVDVGDVQRSPGLLAGEFPAADKLHLRLPPVTASAFTGGGKTGPSWAGNSGHSRPTSRLLSRPR